MSRSQNRECVTGALYTLHVYAFSSILKIKSHIEAIGCKIPNNQFFTLGPRQGTIIIRYSKTCVKRPPKNRRNKDLND